MSIIKIGVSVLLLYSLLLQKHTVFYTYADCDGGDFTYINRSGSANMKGDTIAAELLNTLGDPTVYRYFVVGTRTIGETAIGVGIPDPHAPNLAGFFGYTPKQVMYYEMEWSGDPAQKPITTVLGVKVSPKQLIRMFDSTQYHVSTEGHIATVGFVGNNSIALHIGTDDVFSGYWIYLGNIQVNKNLQESYDVVATHRDKYPGVKAGDILGCAIDDNVLVAARDSGSFTEILHEYWWQSPTAPPELAGPPQSIAWKLYLPTPTLTPSPKIKVTKPISPSPTIYNNQFQNTDRNIIHSIKNITLIIHQNTLPYIYLAAAESQTQWCDVTGTTCTPLTLISQSSNQYTTFVYELQHAVSPQTITTGYIKTPRGLIYF